MKKLLLCITFICTCMYTSFGQTKAMDPTTFAKNYFATWNKTQTPNASVEDLENFLALLTDDVALQHFPYDKTDDREPNGKQVIRKGMSRWRGVNTSYTAKLLEINHGHDVIVIKYIATVTFIDGKTKKERSITKNNLEVLELDNGKVSIIRKYGKY